MLSKDSEYFHDLQTQTGWGQTLFRFAEWCDPKPGWLTLDAGCGPALLPAIFSRFGCQANGIDLDLDMFKPAPLHPLVAVADVHALPFPAGTFDLITATNLLFLLPHQIPVMVEMRRLLRPGGKLALLNPSERLTVSAAAAFAEEKGLAGIARDTFLNWARRAEDNFHWTEAETQALFLEAGLKYMGSGVKIGPGFARFSSGSI